MPLTYAPSFPVLAFVVGDCGFALTPQTLAPAAAMPFARSIARLPAPCDVALTAGLPTTQGFIEYTRDVLLVTTAAHALCAFTPWGSLLLASVPLYAVSLFASACARRSSSGLSAFGLGGKQAAPAEAGGSASPPGGVQVCGLVGWRSGVGVGACVSVRLRLGCASMGGEGVYFAATLGMHRAAELLRPWRGQVFLWRIDWETDLWRRGAIGALAEQVQGANKWLLFVVLFPVRRSASLLCGACRRWRSL